jgi:sensor histidine kinase regulating citrate/malate metabolism
MLADGVSTASEVTETSGRGVGMSAVVAACARLDGQLMVDSEPGQGTRLRFVFPALDRATAELVSAAEIGARATTLGQRRAGVGT